MKRKSSTSNVLIILFFISLTFCKPSTENAQPRSPARAENSQKIEEKSLHGKTKIESSKIITSKKIDPIQKLDFEMINLGVYKVPKFSVTQLFKP